MKRLSLLTSLFVVGLCAQVGSVSAMSAVTLDGIVVPTENLFDADTIVQRLNQNQPPGDGQEVETELVSLDLTGVDPVRLQNAGSFFDIWAGIDLPNVSVQQQGDPNCDLCEEIRRAAESKLADIQSLSASIDEVSLDISLLEQERSQLELYLYRLNNGLATMNGSDSATNETTGETETARNQAARRAYRENTYELWQNGDISSEEKQRRDQHSSNMTEQELEEWANNAEQELENEIELTEDRLRVVNEQREELNAELATLYQQLEDCNREYQTLLDALDDCLNQCSQGPLTPEGLNLGPDFFVAPPAPQQGRGGLFGPIIDFFVAPPEVQPLPPVPPVIPLPDIGLIPFDPFGLGLGLPEQGIPGLGIPPPPPNLGGFGDLFPVQPLPPVQCPFCEPLKKQIETKQALIDMLTALLDTLHDALKDVNRELDAARGGLAEAQAALARLGSGDYARNENTGQTETARNQAARREYRQHTMHEWGMGSISSEEKQRRDRHSYDMSDRELEEWANKAEARLKAERDAYQKEVNRLKGQQANLQKQIGEKLKELADCQEELAGLIALLADCERFCEDPTALNDVLANVPPPPEPRTNVGGYVKLGDIKGESTEAHTWELGGNSESNIEHEYQIGDAGHEIDVNLRIQQEACKDGDTDCAPSDSSDLGTLADCFEQSTANDATCAPLDVNKDNIVDESDWYNFSINSTAGTQYFVQVDGFDGKPGLSTYDLQIFDDCLVAPSNCEDAVIDEITGGGSDGENRGFNQDPPNLADGAVDTRDDGSPFEPAGNIRRDGDGNTLPPGSYFILVDGFSSGDSGDYTLNLTDSLDGVISHVQPDPEPQGGFFCNTLGLFCPNDPLDLGPGAAGFSTGEECEYKNPEECQCATGEECLQNNADRCYYCVHSCPDGQVHPFNSTALLCEPGHSLQEQDNGCLACEADDAIAFTEDLLEEDDEPGFFCNTFGLFCPADNVTRGEDGFSLDDLGGCFGDTTITARSGLCDNLGVDSLDELTPVLTGPNDLIIPLQINGLDGNDALTIDDFTILDDCIADRTITARSGNCDLLDFDPVGPPPGGGLLTGDDFGLGLLNGNVHPLEDPILEDFISVDPFHFGPDQLGFDDSGVGGESAGLPQPGDMTITGRGFLDDPIDVGPPGGGIDLLDPGGIPVSDPPPQPPTQNLEGAIKAAIAVAIARLNLQPGESAKCTVTRTRIGNRIRVSVTCRKVAAEAVCGNGIQEVGEACDGTVGCAPAEFCTAECTCELFKDDDLCAGVDCNDDDPCTIDVCNPADGQCNYGDVEDEHCKDPEDEDEDPNYCLEDGYPADKAACEAKCDWDCQHWEVEEHLFCYVCPDEEIFCTESACDDGDPCTADECDESSNSCNHSPISSGDCAYECADHPFAPFTSKSQCEGQCDASAGNKECVSHFVQNKGRTCWQCAGKDIDRKVCDASKGEYNSRNEANCDSNQEPYFDEPSDCWKCRAKPQDDPPPAQCDSPLISGDEVDAKENAGYECSPVQVGGIVCYSCKAQEKKVECDSPLVESAGSCPGGTEPVPVGDCYRCDKVEDEGPTCPAGSVSDKATCDSQCSAQGGTCTGEGGCYSCTIINCPSGYTKNECPSSCSNGCDSISEGSVSCYTCKQSCEDICAANGLEVAKDYTSYISGYLNGFSCVSGAGISVRTASSGDCDCMSVPDISVDQTVPVCDTTCGPVECGSSTTCSGGENTTITASCNWGGWQKISEFDWRAVVGN